MNGGGGGYTFYQIKGFIKINYSKPLYLSEEKFHSYGKILFV